MTIVLLQNISLNWNDVQIRYANALHACKKKTNSNLLLSCVFNKQSRNEMSQVFDRVCQTMNTIPCMNLARQTNKLENEMLGVVCRKGIHLLINYNNNNQHVLPYDVCVVNGIHTTTIWSAHAHACISLESYHKLAFVHTHTPCIDNVFVQTVHWIICAYVE